MDMGESTITFKRETKIKEKGETISEVDEKYVTLRKSREKALTFNFKAPKGELVDLYRFFGSLDDMEPVDVNIASTGEVVHYFRGMSPLKEETDQGTPLDTFSATLQLRREFI
jgi:hypothetical protein